MRAIDDLTEALASGQIGRRDFLRRAAVLGLSASAMAAILEACGKTDTGNTTANVQDVTIAALLPTSGAYATFGQRCLQAIDLAIADVNKAGGIKSLGGAKLKRVFQDVTSDPTTAQTATETALSQNQVAAATGAYASAITTVVASVTERHQVPLISASVADTLTSAGYKYYFQVAPKASQFGGAVMDYIGALAKKKGTTPRVAIAHENGAFGTSTAAGFVTGAQKNSLNVVANEAYSATFTDATPLVTRLANVKPDFIALASYLTDGILIVKTVKAQNIAAVMIGGAGGFITPDFVKGIGADGAQGLASVAAWNSDLKCPGTADYAKRYQQKYGEFLFEYAGEQYNQIWVLAKAIDKAASADPVKVRTALTTISLSNTLGGNANGCKVQFDSTGWNASVTPVMVQWQGGGLKTIYPDAAATAQAILPAGY